MPDMESATGIDNYFDGDTNLHAILERIAPGELARRRSHLSGFGAWVAQAADPQADYTDRFARPVLEAYDRDGVLANRVRLNPAWEDASRELYARGIVGLNYTKDPAPFAITFAMGYLLAHADISLHCPATMTGAVAYVLDRFAPAPVRERYLHRLTRMDGAALTGGTWATEQHGGSDVGATTTVARRDGDAFRLTGLKWFTSNPAGGIALATARPEGAPGGVEGLGLYLVPAVLEDGSPNPMRLRRLKDKLGTSGVATAEIDLTDTWAVEVAAPPDGLRIMMEALEFSRIHNAMAAIGIQRRALLEAVAYAAGRQAFGHAIIDYPMVQDEILEIQVNLEAGSALAFESVRAFDAAAMDESLNPWMRLVTALAKYMTAEDSGAACRKAMEIIGGNAYTTDYVLHRLLRDAAVLPIWEGPANIQALEVLRLLGNERPGHEAFRNRVSAIVETCPPNLAAQASAVGKSFEDCLAAIDHVRSDKMEAQRHARRLMGLMADTLAAALVLEEASAGDARKAMIARLFIESRLAPATRRGIAPGRGWVQENFDALAARAPLTTRRSA